MIVYENPWFRVLQNGSYFYVDEPKARSGAAVLPVVGNNVWLLEMCRPAQGGSVTWEIPRGYGEAQETTLECALRELKEETGLVAQASELVWLGRVRPNTAILTACVDVYMAKLPFDALCQARDDEARRLVHVPLASLPAQLAAGKIEDSFTLAALSFHWAGSAP